MVVPEALRPYMPPSEYRHYGGRGGEKRVWSSQKHSAHTCHQVSSIMGGGEARRGCGRP